MNRLTQSLSPYLLQHKDNPVDWYPWSDEAFEVARQSDRPIFLSVGYAACHWCHVMERESFENETLAAYLNENFVSIKVDREERPDVDQIYMNAVQVMTGHGGWPMSVFLDHDRQPFYAGTYWPPVARSGMPGFAQVLEAVSDAWTNRRDELRKHADEMAAALNELASGTGEPAERLPGDETIANATTQLLNVMDRRYGGFGRAPKFPHATDLELLIRRGLTTEAPALLEAAEYTLNGMAAGGIRDHIGGGFARYSVDERWLVPHFEKMLYDNALLGEVYTRAFQSSGNPQHAEVAGEIFDYLIRDMTDDEGGFHCSEDADSEGVEGKFYVWDPDDVIGILGQERGERFCQIYDITPGGNFEGHSIPNLPTPLTKWAEKLSIDESELRSSLAGDREKLRQAREQRVRPGRDDKILAAWNSLASRALAIGGAALDQPRYITSAVAAAEFVHTQMRRDNGRLFHAFRHGTAHLDGYVDDYAFTIDAYLAVFGATGEDRWVGRACELADMLLMHFEDRENGGFFYTADDAESLITRTKDWHDGSLISGNAAAASALFNLSQLVQRADYRDSSERALRAGNDVMQQQSAACGALLSTLDRCLHDQEQLVLAVANKEQLAELRPQLHRSFRPRTTLSWVIGEASTDHPTASLNAGKAALGGQPTLYSCQNYSCGEPLSGDALISRLGTDS